MLWIPRARFWSYMNVWIYNVVMVVLTTLLNTVNSASHTTEAQRVYKQASFHLSKLDDQTDNGVSLRKERPLLLSNPKT